MKILSFCIGLLFSLGAAAQNTFPASGNAGIGTSSPTHSLTLSSAGNGAVIYNTADQTTNFERARLFYDSNVFKLTLEAGGTGVNRNMSVGTVNRVLNFVQASPGISGIFRFVGSSGASNTSYIAETSTGTNAGGYQNSVAVLTTVNQSGSAAYRGLWISPYLMGVGSGAKYLIDAGTNSGGSGSGVHTSKFVLTYDGNVGIGVADPLGYKLAVNGNMIATSVTVKLYSNWPDYVFNKDYKLPKLKDVKRYITDKGHLPGIPSADEVSKEGLNLGEINKVLTQKIEELTLYLIDQQEQLKKSFENNEMLKERLDSLAIKVEALKK